MSTAVPSKIYFASDFHLGIPDYESSLVREKKIVRWLDAIQDDCIALYLLGDLFDFWFEYTSVVPKGYVRLLGKLAEFTDKGIPVIFFAGNHDMWMDEYLTREIKLTIHRGPITLPLLGKTFYLAHGDGMGPGDHGFKWMKKLFSSPTCQWLFARLHPNFAFKIAGYLSNKSRYAHQEEDKKFMGEDKEWLILFAKDYLKTNAIDYFVFGHRHLPLNLPIGKGSSYINLGDWVSYFTYGEFDGNTFALKKFESRD